MKWQRLSTACRQAAEPEISCHPTVMSGAGGDRAKPGLFSAALPHPMHPQNTSHSKILAWDDLYAISKSPQDLGGEMHFVCVRFCCYFFFLKEG